MPGRRTAPSPARTGPGALLQHAPMLRGDAGALRRDARLLRTGVRPFHRDAGALLTVARPFHRDAGALLTVARPFHRDAGALLTGVGALLAGTSAGRYRRLFQGVFAFPDLRSTRIGRTNAGMGRTIAPALHPNGPAVLRTVAMLLRSVAALLSSVAMELRSVAALLSSVAMKLRSVGALLTSVAMLLRSVAALLSNVAMLLRNVAMLCAITSAGRYSHPMWGKIALPDDQDARIRGELAPDHPSSPLPACSNEFEHATRHAALVALPAALPLPHCAFCIVHCAFPLPLRAPCASA